MPIKVQPIDTTKPPEKMLVGDYKARRAAAFQSGLMNIMFQPKYVFEQEEYERGYEQDKRVRDEIKNGLR